MGEKEKEIKGERLLVLLLGGRCDIWQVVLLLLTEVAVNYYGNRMTAVVWKSTLLFHSYQQLCQFCQLNKLASAQAEWGR